MITKEQAKQAIALNFPFPREDHLIDKVSDRAWIAYCNLIDQYKSGASSGCGWYDTIRETMLNHGVEPRTAHILSHIRSDI